MLAGRSGCRRSAGRRRTAARAGRRRPRSALPFRPGRGSSPHRRPDRPGRARRSRSRSPAARVGSLARPGRVRGTTRCSRHTLASRVGTADYCLGPRRTDQVDAGSAAAPWRNDGSRPSGQYGPRSGVRRSRTSYRHGYLPGRFKALSRMHAESDLRAFLTWYAERRVDPLASRPQIELLYVRWMQEIRRLKPSTTSRRMSIRVLGKGGKTVLVPSPPAVRRALDQATGDRTGGPILLNTRGVRMDRHAATRRLRVLSQATGMRMPPIHPHMLRHTYVTTMLDAGVDLRDVQIAAHHADPAPPCATTEPATTSTATPTTSSPPTWPPAPERSTPPSPHSRSSLDLADERTAGRRP